MDSSNNHANNELNNNPPLVGVTVPVSVPQVEKVSDAFVLDENHISTTNVMPPLKSLKCRQCKQYFVRPLTLQCLHSFCTDCILSYNGANRDDLYLFMSSVEPPHEKIEAQSKMQQAAASVNSKNKQGNAANAKPAVQQQQQEEEIHNEPSKPKQMLCPTCTDDLHLDPAEDPSEPFLNSRLERLVALVNDTPVLCQNCRASESEVQCSKCESHCCNACWKITHSSQIFQSHKPIPLQHSQLSSLPKCETHTISDLEFFVTEQEVGACQVCLLKGEHVGRPYALVTDVRAQRQAEIENELGQVLEQRARLIAGKKECGQVIEELVQTLEEQKGAVVTNFAAIRAALDEREKETLAALDQLHDAKKSVLEGQISYVNKVVDQIDDGVESVKLVLKHSNPLEVVYSVYVLQDALSIIGDVPPTAPKICSECRNEKVPCHHPAVDSQLPVVLSEKVVSLVQAYASVPEASLVERVAQGKGQPSDLAPAANPEQKKLLQLAAGAATKEEEFGCVLQ